MAPIFSESLHESKAVLSDNSVIVQGQNWNLKLSRK